MTALLIRRLIQMPFILLAIYTLTFLLAWSLPGSPLEHEGRRPKQEIIEAMEAQYHLDSATGFYFSYLEHVSGVSYLRGNSDRIFDMGPCLQYQDWSVNELVGGALPVSMVLGFAAIIIALCIGVFAGVIGAAKPSTILTGNAPPTNSFTDQS